MSYEREMAMAYAVLDSLLDLCVSSEVVPEVGAERQSMPAESIKHRVSP